MEAEYFKWFSHSLNQDMELKVYGYGGKPMLAFPPQSGRFFDLENYGMISAIQPWIDSGKIKVFTVDSVDSQSWANWDAHPADRARRHEEYDRYIMQEVVPFIRRHGDDNSQKCLVSGASMGAYHACNFFLRHPDAFDWVIALSGIYKLDMFIGDYMDDLVYFNSPLAYLPGNEDEWYLQQYQESQIIFCVGQGAWEDEMLADTHEMQNILEEKGIPFWVDYWGQDVNHDWPWWRKQWPYFLGHLLGDKSS
ncbi:MAG: transposase [Chloroflexi bacterium 44-23]|nr:MAG: transposase [Chloroflexi bacterium 44-23]